MLLRWWSTVVFLLCIHGLRAQQTYVDNKQLDCERNHTTALGYTCNASASASASCQSYLTFRSEPPLYNTPSSIAALLRSNPNSIAALNNLSSTSATIPANTVVLVPISDCSCTDGGFYQHNVSYIRRNPEETYFSIANNTYGGLTTCQAMIAQNSYNYRQLEVGANITIPLRCACPSANQTAAGIRFLLTYLIAIGDTIEYMSGIFGDVDIQSILDANELSATQVIFPFTPILIPLTTAPTRINTSATPSTPPAPPAIPVSPTGGGGGGGSSSTGIFIGVGVGVGLLLIFSGFLVWFYRRRRIQKQRILPPAKFSPSKPKGMIPSESKSFSVSSEGIRIAIESLTVYKYEELQKATGDFREENRVKGSVYRGIFNGDFAAVKIMKGDVSGEINILKQINHSNIIRLSGFCLHQGNTYLVYEFAENGSLSDWLHSTIKKNAKNELVMGWKQRVQIAHDVADALNYLHNFITPPYVHKNLKCSNVLLDTNMRAKITNFGLARSVDDNEDGELQLTRHVVGTFGYMPPEYIENGLITPKMDVFALGVLISELLSGKEATTNTRPLEKEQDKDAVALQQGQLSEMIKEVVGGENVREKLVAFMDSGLEGEYPLELAYSMAEVASKCVAADLNDRPFVAEVFVILSKILSSSEDWDPSDELGTLRDPSALADEEDAINYCNLKSIF